jgi:hypothetical protein
MVLERIISRRSKGSRSGVGIADGILARERVMVLVDEEVLVVEGMDLVQDVLRIVMMTARALGKVMETSLGILQRILGLCIRRGRQSGSSRSKHLRRSSRERRLCSISDTILYFTCCYRGHVYPMSKPM